MLIRHSHLVSPCTGWGKSGVVINPVCSLNIGGPQSEENIRIVQYTHDILRMTYNIHLIAVSCFYGTTCVKD